MTIICAFITGCNTYNRTRFLYDLVDSANVRICTVMRADIAT